MTARRLRAACVAATVALATAACDGCGRTGAGGGGPARDAGAWAGFEVSPLPGWDGPPLYGDPARATIADVNGPGIALFDADGDGDLDLYVAQGSTVARAAAGRPGAPDRFFLGDGRGGFAEATAQWGLDQRCWSQGLAVGDVDGDGDADVFVACLGPDVLLRNDPGRFTDVSAASGLVVPGDRRWSTSAAFGDADGDGDLDLYVARYLAFDPSAPPEPRPGMACLWKGVRVSCGPDGLTPEADSLYVNRGDGTFEDASDRVAVPRPAYGLGVLWLGPDIVVANDSTPNFHFRGDGRGGYVEDGLVSGLSRSGDGQEQAGMGVAQIGEDLVMTHFSDDHHTLYRHLGGGMYRDVTFEAGLGAVTLPVLGWGVGAFDFDLDGDEDLLAVHGHVYPQAGRADPAIGYAQRDHVFLQGPPGRFTEAGMSLGLARPHVGRAAAFGDVDGDGDVDAVVVALDGPPALYRSAGVPGPRRWLRFRVTPPLPGAVVSLSMGQRRRIVGGGSFQAASDARVHFGFAEGALGDGQEVLWTVTWPDGRSSQGRTPPGVEVAVRAPPR